MSSTTASTTFTPSPAVKARLSHLRRYANISYLATHKSSSSNDPTIRLPRTDAVLAAQEAHEESVRSEVEGLRERIRAEKEALGKLPAQPKLKSEKGARLNDLLISELVYGKKLLEELPPPGAPEPTSPLNPLLLHRFLSTEIERLVDTSIPLARRELSEVKSKICSEEAEVKTTELLTSALRTRIELLEGEVGMRRTQGHDQSDEVEIAEKIILELEGRYTMYNKAQKKFLRELSKFVNTYLAKLLAAEGLGGPVVGDDLGIDVSSGVTFDKSGKVRREKVQQTIHNMFSSRGKQTGKKRGCEGDSDNDDDDDEEEEEEEEEEERRKEVRPNVVAAQELKKLLEELMNKTLEAEVYVTLERGDSAAARFLVRSGVAVFHPRDARRVRLVEFGRSVED
ncbi:hypothetical protein L211DRAFT_866880 [Terfezia boudieri ATCC MYA-4762]|uniref:Uncharacterized protein n=1 Tax=Terfezia boudieri ATCC MYA-4762 TaxID=1051890 RepID=A0A3N4LXQ1_9PEZI|nr:hypothetical protein L211DRAFT_866880 [Terfezia boudieri ATCC MYA-4762]